MSAERLSEIRERLAKATPGPWHVGEPWMFAGVLHDDGTCSYCESMGSEPAWIGRRDINGTQMEAHAHPAPAEWFDFHVIEAGGPPEPMTVVGMYDYEAGGVIAESDATLIAHAPADLAFLLDLVDALKGAAASD